MSHNPENKEPLPKLDTMEPVELVATLEDILKAMRIRATQFLDKMKEK